MTAIEGVGRPATSRIGGRAASGAGSGFAHALGDRCRRPRIGARRRAAGLAHLHADLAGAGRRNRGATGRRAGMARTCWQCWPSCSAVCWPASRMARPWSVWRSWLRQCREPPIAGWRPWSRLSCCAYGWSWHAGSPDPRQKLFHGKLLKLRHAPLAALAAIAISPRKCDPGRASGIRGFRNVRGGSAARGKAGPARHDGHPTPGLPADRG